VNKGLCGGKSIPHAIARIDKKKRLRAAADSEAHKKRYQATADDERQRAHQRNRPPGCHITSVGEGPGALYSGVNDIRDDQLWSSLMIE
jgi:hypothetical protein